MKYFQELLLVVVAFAVMYFFGYCIMQLANSVKNTHIIYDQGDF